MYNHSLGEDIFEQFLVSVLDIHGVSKMFGEWYRKTNQTEDTNKLTLLAFKIIAIIHNHERRTFCRRGGNPRT
jgi:hypothetical protein